jgi:protocatechuate 3,4-dioxygenase beta subunit
MLLISNKVYAQTDSKEPSGVIAGKVTTESGPIPGVTIIVTPSPGSQGPSLQGSLVGRATTDDQGYYRVTGLAAGDYSIVPFAPSFYYAWSQVYGISGKSVSLDAGETAEGIDFKLTHGGVITGRISDSAGRPLVEERVQLAHIDDNRQRIQMPYNPYNFLTDDRGVYRIYGLEPGRYLVSVGRDVRPGSVSGGGPPRYYPLTYYPGVNEEARAEVVEISSSGEAASIDIVLGKTATSYSARGRVISSETGQPVPDVLVGYGAPRPDGGIGATGFSSNSQTDSRGEFRIDGVTPGQYAAFAVPFNDRDFYSDQTPFQITEADIEGVQVTVHQGGSINGIATVEGAVDPAIAARISQLSLSARNLQNSPGSIFIQPRPVAPDGSFRLTGLSPGKIMIYLSNPSQANGFSIARIEVDGTDQSGGIDVGASQQITGVRLILAYGGGSIRGRVKVQGGVLPESLSLMVLARSTARPGPMASKSARVDARGLFVIQGLADGEYDVTLMFVGGMPGRQGRGVRPPQQRVTVTQDAPADAVLVLDLSGQN